VSSRNVSRNVHSHGALQHEVAARPVTESDKGRSPPKAALLIAVLKAQIEAHRKLSTSLASDCSAASVYFGRTAGTSIPWTAAMSADPVKGFGTNAIGAPNDSEPGMVSL
jgi:hypothetical protein